ncbi:MAG: hypothetical protein RI897_3780 [Verrucomicrobiota bacterium]
MGLPQESGGVGFGAEGFHPAIFCGFHPAPSGGCEVVISLEMKDSVYGVAEDFFRVAGVEFSGLAAGHCGADVAFAGEVE